MNRQRSFLLVFGLAAVLFHGCDMNVNRSVHIREGERSHGQTSVNGNINVGSRSQVEGNCRTVNGSIHVGDDAHVRGLDTVNGGIHLGANVTVDGSAATVNGSIICAGGSKVHGRLSTVNGRIELKNSEVDENLSTVNGNIKLLAQSVVHGNIIIKGRRGHFSSSRPITIRVEDGSVVEGNIEVRDPRNKVEVYIGKDAGVKGEIRNAKVIREKSAFAENPAGDSKQI